MNIVLPYWRDCVVPVLLKERESEGEAGERSSRELEPLGHTEGPPERTTKASATRESPMHFNDSLLF